MTMNNHKYLKKTGKVVYLSVSPQTVLKRIGNDDGRPLLSGDDATEVIYELLESRVPTYKKLADITIDTDTKSVNEIVSAIVEAIQ